MRLVKLALGSVNPTVGSVKSNTDRCIKMALEMSADGATVAAFPEQVLGGYAAEDLVQWRGFVTAQWRELMRFSDATRTTATVYVLGLTVHHKGHLYNCAAVVHAGQVLGLVPKEKLPTYNVFYEARTFSRGVAGRVEDVRGVPFGDVVFEFDFGTMGVEVCEDIWSPDGPMRRRCYAGAELLVNISASPFRMGVMNTRREMLATRSADNVCTLAYVNCVGANDGLIFDGGGFVFSNGRNWMEAPRFVESWSSSVVDLDRTLRMRTENTTWRHDCLLAQELTKLPTVLKGSARTAERGALVYPYPANKSFFLPRADARPDARTEFCEELLTALSLGIGDYYEKLGAFKGLGIALSGGRDSLLTLLIAWRYIQRRFSSLPAAELRQKTGEMMRAFYMPTRYSSSHTQKSAEKVAEELGIPFKVIPMEDAFLREAEAARTMLDSGELTGVTMQNVQARIRAGRMWNRVNTSGFLFLQTGNMSEKAMGYTTIGGDLEGALAVLANVPKTVVIYLLEYLQETLNLEGIRMTLSVPAGPELASNQKGEDELMPFRVLDACCLLYTSDAADE